MLQLPATKWKGLKLLPTAAPSASDETFRQMVGAAWAPADACGCAAVKACHSHQPALWTSLPPCKPALCCCDRWLPTFCLLPCAHSRAPQVRGLIDMLDPELAAALPPLLPRRTPSRLGSHSGSSAMNASAEEQQQQQEGGSGSGVPDVAASPASPGSAEKRAAASSLFEGLCTSDSDDDSDEDWRADLEREAKLQVGG